MIWRKQEQLAEPFTSWTSACCDILEEQGAGINDGILAHTARMSNIVAEVAQIEDGKSNHTGQQKHLIHLGVKAQLERLTHQVPPNVAISSVYYFNPSLLIIGQLQPDLTS